MSIITLQQLQKDIGVHPNTIRRLALENDFPLRKANGVDRGFNFCFTKELESWLEENNTLYKFKNKTKANS